MIFTDRTITVRKGESRIDEPIVVYRGDYELEVRFTILNSRFKFMSGTNMIESEKASYGQLAILTPYGGNIFSDVVKCNDGSVTFVLTAEMLNQIEEVGLYSFQIRLMDYNKESRVSIPPIEFGIEVREPIASEDHDNSVNNAIVGYSIAKVVDPKEENVGDTFDENGNYIKTKWKTGDRISEGKLNKIEDAIDKINENEVNNTAVLSRRIDNNFNVLDSIMGEIKQNSQEKIREVESELAQTNAQLSGISLVATTQNFKELLCNLTSNTTITFDSGIYNLDGEIILLESLSNVVIDLSKATLTQGAHGFGWLELIDCENILIKGGVIKGTGIFPKNSVTNNVLHNEKRNFGDVWEFHKNNTYTDSAPFNGGYLGNFGIGLLIDSGNSNITIDGVEVSHFNGCGIGIGFKGTQDNGYNYKITIKNCYTHHNFDRGIQVLNADGVEVINNKSSNNGARDFTIDDYEIDPGYGITCTGARKYAKNVTIRNNQCYDNNRKGIDVHGGEDIDICYNKIKGTPMCGISITKSNVGMLISRIFVENNLINHCGFMNSPRGWGSGAYLSTYDYLYFKNNKIINSAISQDGLNQQAYSISVGLGGEFFIEDNLILDSGSERDISIDKSNAYIRNNTIINKVATKSNRTSIYCDYPTGSDNSHSYIEIANNRIEVPIGNGLRVIRFQDGKIKGNRIIAPIRFKWETDELNRSKLNIYSDNNFDLLQDKEETTKGVDMAFTHGFEVKITNGVISHNANPDIISEVIDNIFGFRIVHKQELKLRGVSIVPSNSTTAIDVSNVYVREYGRNFVTFGLGTLNETHGESASSFTNKTLTYIIMYSYI